MAKIGKINIKKEMIERSIGKMNMRLPPPIKGTKIKII
jgi:hypothetical protein